MKYSKSVNLQLLGIIVVLLGALAVLGDGSPPSIQERSSNVASQ